MNIETFLHRLTQLTKETGVALDTSMMGHGIRNHPVLVLRQTGPDDAGFAYFEQGGRIAFGLMPEKTRQ